MLLPVKGKILVRPILLKITAQEQLSAAAISKESFEETVSIPVVEVLLTSELNADELNLPEEVGEGFLLKPV